MRYEVVTTPSILVVSLDEAKYTCRVDGVDHDTAITSMIKAATIEAQIYMGRLLLSQQVACFFDDFSDLRLVSVSPVTSIVSITYKDLLNVTQTLSSAKYKLIKSEPAIIVAEYNYEFPKSLKSLDAIKIEAMCGYASSADVPDDIKHWIRLRVKSLFDNSDFNQNLMSLLDQHIARAYV